MDAKLVVVGGKANKSEVELKLPTVIGRGRDADLTVAHPTVSRHHCVVFEQDGVLCVRDNASLNGTLVDGHKVQEAELRPGETLTVGPLTFRADYQLTRQSPRMPAFPATGDVAETIGSPGAPVASMDETVHFDDGAPAAAPAANDADADSDFDFFSEEPATSTAAQASPGVEEDSGVLQFLDESRPTVPVPAADPSDATIDIEPASSADSDEFSLAPIDDKPAKAESKTQRAGSTTTAAKEPAAKAPGAKAPGAKDDDLDDFFDSIGVK
jgi:predicted component of type VI protein secretion system